MNPKEDPNSRVDAAVGLSEQNSDRIVLLKEMMSTKILGIDARLKAASAIPEEDEDRNTFLINALEQKDYPKSIRQRAFMYLPEELRRNYEEYVPR